MNERQISRIEQYAYIGLASSGAGQLGSPAVELGMRYANHTLTTHQCGFGKIRLQISRYVTDHGHASQEQPIGHHKTKC